VTLPTGSSSEGRCDDQGFSFVELMVVLLVMAILLAIAIPTLLGTSGAARDRAGQSNLVNALTEMKTLFPTTQSYATVALNSATLTASAPEFSWTQSAACTGLQEHCVSEYPVDVVNAGDGAGVILATKARTGWCSYVVDLMAAPTAVAFVDGSGTAQFLAGTTDGNVPNMQETAGAPMTQGGVFYSQKRVSSCDARTPISNSSAWSWGSALSSAPIN
jgi:type IV pilus assembly protein PilA